MSDKQKAFEEALALRKKEKQEEENRKNGSYTPIDYETIHYLGLSKKDPAIFRIVGKPLSVRDEGWDPKVVNVSWILGDGGKNFRCVWPDKNENSDWILWKVFNTVLAYDWDNTSNSKIFQHKDNHPGLFSRVFKNNKMDNALESGWAPTTSVCMNVIDRMNYQWHVENKSFKVLSSKVTIKKNPTTGEERIYAREGVAKTMYNLILDDIATYNGPIDSYDVLGLKLGGDPWYKVYHPTQDANKIQVDFPNALQFVNSVVEIIPDEMTWKKYDFDKLYKITSYQKILKNLGKFIQAVDLSFNTTYFNELTLLAEEEKKRYQEQDSKTYEKELTNTNESQVVVKQETPAQTPVQPETPAIIIKDSVHSAPSQAVVERPVVSREPIAQKFDPKTLDSNVYKGIASLTPEELDLITGVGNDGQLTYTTIDTNGIPITIAKDNNGNLAPMTFTICPYTGVAY